MFANVVLAQLLICLVTAIPLPESAKELHPDTGRNIVSKTFFLFIIIFIFLNLPLASGNAFNLIKNLLELD